MQNKLIAEFIGTYFLYLLIALCVVPPGIGAFTPLAVGIGLTALVYACGHISKAHFNPATTITYLCAGTYAPRAFLPFIIIIFTAASLAAWTVQALQPQALIEVTALVIDWPKVIIAEALFTFALMWVILNVAIAKGTAGNQFYGISIGAIVTAGAYAVGPISFAAFNPAVTLALCINGFIPWSAFPVYCLVQATAAACAGFLFRRLHITNPSEYPA
jgi:aquaporin Z